MQDNERAAILSLCDYSGAWSRPFIDAGYIVIRVDPKHDNAAGTHGPIDQGNTGYTVGSAGSGTLWPMGDGGFGLAYTAGALAERMEEEGGYYIDSLFHNEDGEGAEINVEGVMIAPPCTDFANSGARHFAAKDADGRTEKSVSIVRDCLRVKDAAVCDWWVLENPRGRIKRLVPELGDWLMHFDPADYAGYADYPERESYSKDTYLYGDFNTDLPRNPRDIVWYYDKKGNRGSWQWKHLGGKSERTKELRSITPTGFARAFFCAQMKTKWRPSS